MTLVREFHEAFGLTVADVPSVPSDSEIRLRVRLIKEETAEVCDELIRLIAHRRNHDSFVDVAQTLRNLLGELCDLRYVTEGTAVSFGLDIDRAYEAVHAANMAKVWPDGEVHRDSGGKVIKPPNHQSADLSIFVHVVDSLEAAE